MDKCIRGIEKNIEFKKYSLVSNASYPLYDHFDFIFTPLLDPFKSEFYRFLTSRGYGSSIDSTSQDENAKLKDSRMHSIESNKQVSNQKLINFRKYQNNLNNFIFHMDNKNDQNDKIDKIDNNFFAYQTPRSDYNKDLIFKSCSNFKSKESLLRKNYSLKNKGNYLLFSNHDYDELHQNLIFNKNKNQHQHQNIIQNQNPYNNNNNKLLNINKNENEKSKFNIRKFNMPNLQGKWKCSLISNKPENILKANLKANKATQNSERNLVFKGLWPEKSVNSQRSMNLVESSQKHEDLKQNSNFQNDDKRPLTSVSKVELKPRTKEIKNLKFFIRNKFQTFSLQNKNQYNWSKNRLSTYDFSNKNDNSKKEKFHNNINNNLKHNLFSKLHIRDRNILIKFIPKTRKSTILSNKIQSNEIRSKNTIFSTFTNPSEI